MLTYSMRWLLRDAGLRVMTIFNSPELVAMNEKEKKKLL